jgi:hypothetical protein
MEETLKYIYSNVNEWLRFAETKNAALISFNLVSIFGAATIITQSEISISKPILYYLYDFITWNFLGLSLALYSFWPVAQILFNSGNNQDTVNVYFKKMTSKYFKKIKNLLFEKPEDEKAKNNIFYYAHIKEYDSSAPESYLDELYKACKKEGSNYTRLECDYATQIIINSQMTFRKYRYFKVALFCAISALWTPIVPILFGSLFRITNCLTITQCKKYLIQKFYKNYE